MNGYGRGVRAILAVLLLGSAAPAFAETAPREKPAVVEEQGVAIEVPDPTPTGLLIAWKPALLSVRVDSGSGSRFGSDSLQPLRGLARYTTRLGQDKPYFARFELEGGRDAATRCRAMRPRKRGRNNTPVAICSSPNSQAPVSMD